MDHYDVIVLGAGGVGSATLYHLAKRGVRAIGIDRFDPPHDRGSTHGQSRVIRQAYYEHPNYVPLLRESYREWFDVETLLGRKLFHQVGLLEVGPGDGAVVPNVLKAAAQYDIRVESLTPAQVEAHWPGLRVDPSFAGVFEPAAGYLLVEDCVQAHLDLARAAGAELLANTEVVGVKADASSVVVTTSAGLEITASKLIVAAGAWSPDQFLNLGIDCVVRRKSLFWFACDDPQYKVENGFPVFLFELPTGIFYGFPKMDDVGLKFAEHSGGYSVTDPLTVDRSIDAMEQSRLVEVLARMMPGVSTRVTHHAVCMYTMSPDEHFIIDRHPTSPNVVFAAGLSGHGFKFTGVLGRALADLAMQGGTTLPIDFLSLRRLGQAS